MDERVIDAKMYEVVDDWNCTLILKQSNDGCNKDNYYKIQMLKKSNASDYCVWCWWGLEVLYIDVTCNSVHDHCSCIGS